MNKIIFFLLLLIITYPSKSQENLSSSSKKAIKNYTNAIEFYEILELDKAIEFLNNAVKEDKNFIEAYLLLAQVFTDQNNFKDAISAYEIGLEINPYFFPNGFLFQSELQMMIGEYEGARDNLKKILSLKKARESLKAKAKKILINCEFSINAKNNPVPFNPINLGENINSQYDEYWPSLSADEEILVYTVLLPIDESNPSKLGNRQEDFFISNKTNGKWGKSSNVGKPLNSEANEGAQTISADGKFMIFTACKRLDSKGGCDLYYSQKEGDSWTIPQNIGSPINSRFRETQPSISPDGKVLYFVSNRTGGKGKRDIWRSSLSKDGYWNEPENLGDSINTRGDEISPFIHSDNRTLYFASNEHAGLGGFDLFKYTHTCYKGERPACGECFACELRLNGFKKAGLKDPIEYKSD